MRAGMRADRPVRTLLDVLVLPYGRTVAVAVLGGPGGLGPVVLAGTAGFRAGLRRARPEA